MDANISLPAPGDKKVGSRVNSLVVIATYLPSVGRKEIVDAISCTSLDGIWHILHPCNRDHSSITDPRGIRFPWSVKGRLNASASVFWEPEIWLGSTRMNKRAASTSSAAPSLAKLWMHGSGVLDAYDSHDRAEVLSDRSLMM